MPRWTFGAAEAVLKPRSTALVKIINVLFIAFPFLISQNSNVFFAEEFWSGSLVFIKGCLIIISKLLVRVVVTLDKRHLTDRCC